MTGLPHTAPEHEHSAAIDVAVTWLVANWQAVERPVVPFTRQRFGLSNLEAIEALREARRILFVNSGGANASAE